MNTDGGSIARHFDVHGSNNGSNRWFVTFTDTRMSNVSTKDNGRPLGNEAKLTTKRRVDTTQLDVDLEGQVSTVLFAWSTDVLHEHTLRRKTDISVSATLDLTIEMGIVSGEDTKDELRIALGSIGSCLISILDRSLNISVGH